MKNYIYLLLIHISIFTYITTSLPIQEEEDEELLFNNPFLLQTVTNHDGVFGNDGYPNYVA